MAAIASVAVDSSGFTNGSCMARMCGAWATGSSLDAGCCDAGLYQPAQRVTLPVAHWPRFVMAGSPPWSFPPWPFPSCMDAPLWARSFDTSTASGLERSCIRPVDAVGRPLAPMGLRGPGSMHGHALDGALTKRSVPVQVPDLCAVGRLAPCAARAGPGAALAAAWAGPIGFSIRFSIRFSIGFSIRFSIGLCGGVVGLAAAAVDNWPAGAPAG